MCPGFFTHTRRPARRRTSSSSPTSIRSAAVSRRSSSRSASSRASACCSLRGKPSSRNPSRASPSLMRPVIIPTITASGTSSPASMYRFASLPRALPSATCLRRMSPVEMWGSAKSSRRRSACVPLPAPGGPSRIRLSSDTTAADYPLARLQAQPAAPRRSPSRRPRARLLQESLVAAHHQLRLELLHRFQRHADHDQDRGAAEVELLMGAREQDRRECRDSGEEQGAREGEAGEDPVQEFGRRPSRAHARDEPAVLLQVVGLIDRVERDGGVEVGEDEDEDRLPEYV